MKKFIAMWDNTGLECLIDFSKHEKEVDEWEKKKVWNTLKELPLREVKPEIPLQQMIMRAKFNSQRHYEIYLFSSNEDEEFIREMFENDPQIIVNWIRENGYKYYSDRVKMKDVVIV